MLSRSRLLTLVGALLGTLLFAYAVDRAGISEILDGIQRVGWGLLVILALAGLRFVLRAECWRLCVPPTTRLTRGQAFSAFLAGDAVGNVTPLGMLASEPTKVLLSRRHLAAREAVSSLALENVVYAASVVTMIGIGVVVTLATLPLPDTWRWGGIAVLVGLAAIATAGLRLLQGTWDDERGVRPRWREKLAGVRRSIVGFSADYRGRLWRVFVLDLLFHLLAVIEIFVTMQWLLGRGGVTFPQAVIFEALNRVVTVVFKFVPFRIGVDEALTGGLATALAIDPAAGVVLAVVRKIRNLFWSGVGLAIVIAHPARRRTETADALPDTAAPRPRRD